MPVDLYDFTDYRVYLRAWFAQPEAPTQTAFAQKVAKSKAYMTAILKGERELGATQVSTWARHLGLGPEETAYLAALVDLESESKARRVAAWVHVKAVQLFRTAAPVDDTLLEIYRQWHLGAILELARIPGFRADPSWIADQLSPRIPVDDAAEALEELKARGLLREREGTLVPSQDLIATSVNIPPGLLSQALWAWYRSMLERALGALSSAPPAERHVATVMAPLSAATYERVARRLAEMEKELIGMMAKDPDPERVYQIGFLLFPVSARPDEGEGEGEPSDPTGG